MIPILSWAELTRYKTRTLALLETADLLHTLTSTTAFGSPHIGTQATGIMGTAPIVLAETERVIQNHVGSFVLLPG